MSNERVTLTKPLVALGTNAPIPRPQTSSPAAELRARAQETDSVAKTAPANVQEIAERIQSYLRGVNRSLEFRVDSASGRTVVTVRDAESGDVIRQIPNEEVLRFAQLAEEQTIVLLNEKV